MKKRATTAKRATKDLQPRKDRDVRGGSQSTGAGAGKVTFSPFTITKTTDTTSPS